MANEYLSRTPGSAGNRRIWTYSFWYKKTKNGVTNTFLDVNVGGYFSNFGISSNDLIYFYEAYSGVDYGYSSEARYRDNSSLYHIVLSVDTTQGSASNRVKLYVNGTQQSFSQNYGDFPQNLETYINSTSLHKIGYNTDQSNSLNGYMTDIILVDGQALTPSVFAETNSTTGEWIPKSPASIRSTVGSFGTNGFFLPFTNKSSTTTLGYDYKTTDRSSNNDWTLNNFSTIDAISEGAGNKFCALNPLVNGVQLLSVPTAIITDGALMASTDATDNKIAAGTLGVKTGKWYWEVKATASGSTSNGDGVGITNLLLNNEIMYRNSGSKRINGSESSYGATWVTNDIIGVALDMDAGTITMYKNGSSQGTMHTGISNSHHWSPLVYCRASNVQLHCNFGQGDWVTSNSGAGYSDGNSIGKFQYQPPSGYLALCDSNMGVPTIPKGTSHFKVITYTGDGSTTRSITGLGFKPDVVWIKARSGTDEGYYHRFCAIPLGSTSGYLSPHSQDANQGSTNGHLSSYDADGFTLTSPGPGVNQSGSTYVAWCWKMSSGVSVSNTQGTINSTVWANPTAGQSLIAWTGAGGGGTKSIGHGLSAAPGLVIVKDTSGGGTNWVVWHKSFASSSIVQVLSGAMANITDLSNYWGSSIPSSSVIYLDSSGSYDCNQNGRSMMALAFTEVEGYSKFGSYVYTNSTDGNFVYTGFKPAFILIKNTDNSEGWYVVDGARNSFNGGQTAFMKASSAVSESTSNSSATDSQIDLLSNGFKLRDLGSAGAGEVTFGTRNYIYAAFAESPFTYSNSK